MDLGKFEWAQVIAVLALSVAVTNAYFTFFRKGDLQPRIGETMLLQLAESGRLRVKPEVTIHNPGATLAVVHELEWGLRALSDDSRQKLVWEENLTTVFVDDDETRRTDTRFESFPGTLVIPKGDAISKRMQLSTEHALPLKPGDYELTLKVSSDGTRSEANTLKTKLRVTDEDIRYLKDNQLSPSNESRRVLRFLYQRGESTDCFLRARNS